MDFPLLSRKLTVAKYAKAIFKKVYIGPDNAFKANHH